MTDALVIKIGRSGYSGQAVGERDVIKAYAYTSLTQSSMNVILCVDALNYDSEFINRLKTLTTENKAKMGLKTHFLTLLLVNSEAPDYPEAFAIARQLCSDNQFVWLYDEAVEQPIICESSVEDYYGLRNVLEQTVTDAEIESIRESVLKAADIKPVKPFKERFKDFCASCPWVSFSLVIVNIIVFTVCTFTGQLLYNKGAVGLKLVSENGEWYRLITSMFLHANATHIFSNMLLLYVLGVIVEKEVKPVMYLVIYFLSGIWGSLLTFLSEYISGEYIAVIGASGAVFGVLGALLALVIFKRVKGRTLQLRRVLLVIILTVCDGFTAQNVANWAHLGGVIAGFIIGVIFCLVTDGKTTQGTNNEN